MPATLGMRSMVDLMMKNVLMGRLQADDPKNRAVRPDVVYDMWRLMIILHIGKWTTSKNPVAIDAVNQAIWPQTARMKRTCATIVSGRGMYLRTVLGQSLTVKEVFRTHVTAIVDPVQTASEAKALTKARRTTR